MRRALIAASARFQHIPIQSCQLRSLGESSQFEFEHLASVSSAMFIFPSVCPPGFIVVFARSHLAQSYPAPALHHSNRELAIAVPSAKQASSCEHLCECWICQCRQTTFPMEVCSTAPEQWFLQLFAGWDFASLPRARIYLQRTCNQAAGSNSWCFLCLPIVCFVGFCIVSASSPPVVLLTGCDIC